MSVIGSQIVFKELLERNQYVQIPMIQRDYAQGRESEKEVRDQFLDALYLALSLPAQDKTLPLNLDFIYGSVEGNEVKRFFPLDGQQRLTTLFLIHWYLSWRDQCWDVFKLTFSSEGTSRFCYNVRPSSTEFFNALVNYIPECEPNEVNSLSSLITDQSWYFRYWRLDPTIQSSLTMLDAIHLRFVNSSGLYARITSVVCPAITFQLLDMENFGLSDDLYIKMNSRGKPLTQFETFKASFEQVLESLFREETLKIGVQEISTTEFFSIQMDTKWADFFWPHRDPVTNIYDEAVMNLFRIVILLTRSPHKDSFIDDVVILRNKWQKNTYSLFHKRGWLDREFSEMLILLLEKWSCGGGGLNLQLPNKQYFDEIAFFSKAVKEPTSIGYEGLVQFAGYVLFLKENDGDFEPEELQEWMRIVSNLSVNTEYNRPADLQRSIGGLLTLLSKSKEILDYFASPGKSITGFNEQQVSEEKLKAELILGHDTWRSLIDQAEGHGYFRGQIDFLLDFSGVTIERLKKSIKEWDVKIHRCLQEKFQGYLEKANYMFSQNGLKIISEYRWQRALLSLGDYLLQSSQNKSFLVNSSEDQASWKRLLKGTGRARGILKLLWDRISMDLNIVDQLDQIINSALDMEEWRYVLVHTPNALKYCEAQSIRYYSDEQVYLLKKSRMNGAHVELFTYSLYLMLFAKQSLFEPFQISYTEVNGSEREPHIVIYINQKDYSTNIKIYFYRGKYIIRIDVKGLGNHSDKLADFISLGFKKDEISFSKEISRLKVEKTLKALAKTFCKVP